MLPSCCGDLALREIDYKLARTDPTVSPHDLCVAHGLVDAREGAHGLLHHLLAHAEHVVLLKELIRQLCHTQTRVNLLHLQKHTEHCAIKTQELYLGPPGFQFVTKCWLVLLRHRRVLIMRLRPREVHYI